jgi:hypothetical protein
MDCGSVGGDAAEVFAVEEFDDLGAALGPPLFGGGDGFAVVEDERVGEVGPGVGFGLVIIDGVGAVGVRLDSGAQGGDVEEVEEALVVFGCGELDRGGRGLGAGGQEDEHQDDEEWARLIAD